MNKDEFEARLKQLYAEMRERRDEIIRIRKEYAKEHAPFKVGDEVVCYGKRGVITQVSVSGVLITSFDYKWQPYKKDGSLSYERDLWSKFEKA